MCAISRLEVGHSAPSAQAGQVTRADIGLEPRYTPVWWSWWGWSHPAPCTWGHAVSTSRELMVVAGTSPGILREHGVDTVVSILYDYTTRYIVDALLRRARHLQEIEDGGRFSGKGAISTVWDNYSCLPLVDTPQRPLLIAGPPNAKLVAVSYANSGNQRRGKYLVRKYLDAPEEESLVPVLPESHTHDTPEDFRYSAEHMYPEMSSRGYLRLRGFFRGKLCSKTVWPFDMAFIRRTSALSGTATTFPTERVIKTTLKVEKGRIVEELALLKTIRAAYGLLLDTSLLDQDQLLKLTLVTTFLLPYLLDIIVYQLVWPVAKIAHFLVKQVMLSPVYLVMLVLDSSIALLMLTFYACWFPVLALAMMVMGVSTICRLLKKTSRLVVTKMMAMRQISTVMYIWARAVVLSILTVNSWCMSLLMSAAGALCDFSAVTGRLVMSPLLCGARLLKALFLHTIRYAAEFIYWIWLFVYEVARAGFLIGRALRRGIDRKFGRTSGFSSDGSTWREHYVEYRPPKPVCEDTGLQVVQSQSSFIVEDEVPDEKPTSYHLLFFGEEPADTTKPDVDQDPTVGSQPDQELGRGEDMVCFFDRAAMMQSGLRLVPEADLAGRAECDSWPNLQKPTMAVCPTTAQSDCSLGTTPR